MQSSSKENTGLNFLKGIACLIVILLHCPIPGLLGNAIIYGLRFSVPIFFMITGYFSYNKNRKWILKQIKKTLVLILQGELISGSVLFLLFLLERKNFSWIDFISQSTILYQSIRTLFFGSIFNSTLWYLYALLWSFVILYLLNNLPTKIYNYFYFLIPMLLFIHIGGRLYIQNHSDINKYIFLFRSSLLFGIPFVYLGRLISQFKYIIKRFLTLKTTYCLLISGIAFQILEFIIWRQYMDLQFSTIVISLALFFLASEYWHPSSTSIITRLGRELSALMYILHAPIINIVNFILPAGSNLFLFFKPFIVIFSTCLCAYTIFTAKKLYAKTF